MKNLLHLFFKVCLASIFLFILFLSHKSFAQENDISGTVTYLGKPLANVNVTINKSNRGTTTALDGTFSLKVNVGKLLRFQHVGFKPLEIVVEDVTDTLRINMDDFVEILDEVELTGRGKELQDKDFNKVMSLELETSIGRLNPNSITGAVHYMSGKELSKIASPTFEDALNRYSGVEKKGERLYYRGGVMSIDIDGLLYEVAPPIPYSEVEHVYMIKSKLLIVVRTKNAPEVKALEKEKRSQRLLNPHFYQNDAIVIPKKNDPWNSKSPLKRIYGKVSTSGEVLEKANIQVVGSNKGTSTDPKGIYELQVKVGDEISYSHQGLHTVTIVVEDVTSEINIDMVTLQNSLDEVVIIAKNKKGQVLERSLKAGKQFETSRGSIKPKEAGYSVGFIDGQRINFALYNSITEAIQGKISGVSKKDGLLYLRGANSSITQDYPAAWELDGNFTAEEPIGVNINEITNIYLLRGPAATVKYGTLGAGGVIVVKTTMGNAENKSDTTAAVNKLTNQNYYQDDAVTSITSNINKEYVEIIKSFQNSDSAYSFYTNRLAAKLSTFDQHLDVAQTFSEYYKDKYKTKEILMELAIKHDLHPEILKAVAYHLQKINQNRTAIKIYQRLLGLRPNYGQSFRDLANALKDNDQYKLSWNYYMNLLMRSISTRDEGIGQIAYHEMEYLYFNRPNQTEIKQQFTPRNKDHEEFRNDVRFLIEWNTSEAEFDVEFVGPDRRSYIFEHTLVANQELITREKRSGSSSKEFLINEIGDGDWLMNLTYFGNKKTAPTYLKLTTYYNWGKPQQRQVIDVYKLENVNQKVQIKKINKNSLSI